ncbi:MAG: hypothetical protein GY719_30310 [bacterium]|nr:hypothetical protein [bacterium]
MLKIDTLYRTEHAMRSIARAVKHAVFSEAIGVEVGTMSEPGRAGPANVFRVQWLAELARRGDDERSDGNRPR